MITSSHRSRRRRLAGEIDVLDLVLGLGLALGLPFLCFVGHRILEPRLPEDPFAFGDKPIVNPPLDEEEVTARWKHAEEIYTNGKGYVRAMEEQSDAYLRDHYRQWAVKTLQKAKSWYEELEKLIVEDEEPQTRARFSSYLDQIAARKQEIDPEVVRVRNKDPLKRPGEG